MKPQLYALIVMLLVGIQLAITVPVSACSGMFRETTLKEHIDGADLVLVGTVTGSSGMSVYDANYTIQVESYLKGQGPDALLITGFGDGGGDCLNAVHVGEQWLFFVDGDPKSDEVLQASYLQVYDAIREANVETITAVKTMIGHEPVQPYSTPLWTLIKYWTYSPAFKVATLIGIPGLIIAGGLALGMRAKRRQTKKKNSFNM